MSPRYFSSSPLKTGPLQLAGAEAHHLLHVMRAAVGDQIVLFDGVGGEFSARIESANRKTVDCHVLAERTVDRELPHELVVGVAFPKGERRRWLVEKATELGITRLVPVETSRSAPQPNKTSRERLRRTVIEACKQCGRNRLMEIGSRVALAEFLRAAPTTAHRWMAHRQDGSGSAGQIDAATGLPTWLLVGPEGGFSDSEAAQAIATGWSAVDLGPRILRVETAAVALAGLVSLRPAG